MCGVTPPSRRLATSRTLRLLGVAAVAATALTVLQLARPGSASAAPIPVLGKRIIGYSVQHRPLVAYHLGNPAAKTTALLIGQMHGDEHAGVVVAGSLVHGSVSVEGINLWVVPTMNPDGDAAHTRQNAHHVDLNRNWPYRWRHLTGMYYSGTRPLSEPETRAMYRFLLHLRPKYVLVLHQPLRGVDTTDGGAIAVAFRHALSRNLGLPEKAFNCWSACYGSMTPWYTNKRHLGIGETVEFGWHPTHGYLVNRARRGIIAALHGHFGSLARHNPRFRITVSGGVDRARITGWMIDIDNHAAHLAYRVLENGRTLSTGRASAPHGAGHSISVSLAAKPGRHRYCTVITNIGAGTGDPRTCSTVMVTAPAK
jgi:murein peptide amidase A